MTSGFPPFGEMMLYDYHKEKHMSREKNGVSTARQEKNLV